MNYPPIATTSRGPARRVHVQMAAEFVPVPADHLTIWREGLAAIYDQLEHIVERKSQKIGPDNLFTQ